MHPERDAHSLSCWKDLFVSGLRLCVLIPAGVGRKECEQSEHNNSEHSAVQCCHTMNDAVSDRGCVFSPFKNMRLEAIRVHEMTAALYVSVINM